MDNGEDKTSQTRQDRTADKWEYLDQLSPFLHSSVLSCLSCLLHCEALKGDTNQLLFLLIPYAAWIL